MISRGQGRQADTDAMSLVKFPPLSLGWSWSGEGVPDALVDHICTNEPNGGIITVSGPSGSGSETLAMRLAEALPASRHVSFASDSPVIAQVDQVSRNSGWATIRVGSRSDTWSGFLLIRLASAAETESADDDITERVLSLPVVALHVMRDPRTDDRMILLVKSGN